MTSKKHLRPEGRVLSWDQLTRDQRKAVTSMLAAIEEASQKRDPSDRWSRVCFLHGARGTGKSSLVVSLRAAFSKESGEWVSSTSKDVSVEVPTMLESLRKKVIWLDWLDMDPLPPSTHLMSAVLSRIEKAAVRRQSQGSVSDKVDDQLFRYRRVQIDAAESWEANLREKAPHTDLEVWAGDVVRAERKKTELHDELRARIDGICSEVLSTENALFVLPVDDFDLNPARAVELLKLLRGLSLPRLFTVILGDIDVASHVFYLSTRGELVRTGRLEGIAGTQDTDVIASESAAAAIRKLIPPEQVLQLKLVPLPDAPKHTPFKDRPSLGDLLQQVPIWFILPGYDPAFGGPPPPGKIESRQSLSPSAVIGAIAQEPHASRIGTSLMESPEWYARSLGAFFFGDALFFGRSREGKVERVHFPYPGAELLRTSPRHLTDLWMALNNLLILPGVKPLALESEPAGPSLEPNVQAQTAVLDFAVKLFEQAISEDAGLTVEYRREGRGAIHYNDMSEEWELDIGHFAVTSRFGTPLELRIRRGLDVVAHRIVRWDARVSYTDAAGHTNASRLLTERTVGALCLLHDLLLLQGQGSVPVTVSDAAMSKRAYARWSTGGEALEVPWFSDIWSTFWETSLFLDTWNQVKRRARDLAIRVGWMTLEDIAMFLMCGWAVAGLWVLTREEGSVQVRELRSLFLHPEPLDIPAEEEPHPLITQVRTNLVSATKTLAQTVRRRIEQRKDDRVTNQRIAWLITLGGLFTPECGCFVEKGKGWYDLVKDLHDALDLPPAATTQATEPALEGSIPPPRPSSSSRGSSDDKYLASAWEARITSQIAIKRVRRLFGEPPWNPSALWFLDPQLAEGMDVEPFLQEASLFDKQPANCKLVEGVADRRQKILRDALRHACIRSEKNDWADKIYRALKPGPSAAAAVKGP